MIHAAVFRTCDPAERATLIVSGAPDQIALNIPPGGCWRPLPPGQATGHAPGEAPTLGSLSSPAAGMQPGAGPGVAPV